MRAVITAMSLSLLVAEPALACALIFEPGPPNESYAEFAARQEAFRRRLERERQQEDWRTTDVVFLARVTSLRLVSTDRVDVSLEPVVQIHGSAQLPHVVRDQYNPYFGSDCGPAQYAAIGDLVIVYANRPNWRTWPPNWGQPSVRAVKPVYKNRDPQVATALRAAASRLRPNEH